MNKISTAISVLRSMSKPVVRPLWALLSAENVKTLAYELARQRLESLYSRQSATNVEPPAREPLDSLICNSSDWRSSWLPYWAAQIHMQPALHRKIWEFAFIAQALHARDMLRPERRGLGFGCGREPLASVFAARGCSVVATDLAPDDRRARGWNDDEQHAGSLENVWVPALCPEQIAIRNLEFRPADMNDVPADLYGHFDFCWSSCALEHLGSIENGLRFIRHAARCLKPGGVAVHTTELNLDPGRTLDHHPTVLFRSSDFHRLAVDLACENVSVRPIAERDGDPFLDGYIDTPPYPHPASVGSTLNMLHLRLVVASFRTTSIGLVMTKAS
jgi:SAM-dependent methyltransferase